MIFDQHNIADAERSIYTTGSAENENETISLVKFKWESFFVRTKWQLKYERQAFASLAREMHTEIIELTEN